VGILCFIFLKNLRLNLVLNKKKSNCNSGQFERYFYFFQKLVFYWPVVLALLGLGPEKKED
jgi:hypothetical protein